MRFSCSQQTSQLKKILILQTQLNAQLADFSNFKRDEKIARLNNLFKIRSQIRKLTKETRPINLEQAEKIIGKENFFGPKEVNRALGIDIFPKQITEVGFTEAELEQAKKLNHFLVLRIDKANDGEQLTMQKIMELKENKTVTDNGKLLLNTDWYQNEDFFINEPLKLSWALVSREVVEDTTSKNYLQQYDALIAYLETKVLKDQNTSKNLLEAIEKYQTQKDSIESLIKTNLKEAAKALENLKITKLLRRTPTEIIYDLTITADGKPNGQKLLPNTYDWSSRRDSDGYLVRVGKYDAAGGVILRYTPDSTGGSLGVCLSRRSIEIE